MQYRSVDDHGVSFDGPIAKKLDTISNNVANVNTNSFKRRDVQFQDLLFQQLNNQIVGTQETGRNTPNGIRIGSGAKSCPNEHTHGARSDYNNRSSP
ncbi:hypothetical protein KHA80_11520 [Anaerobacillus sp. HL2]|nr:hypothetical protein KHA80_11520 [Anaerobacillus sp. HL2]